MKCGDCRKEMAGLESLAKEDLSVQAQAHLVGCRECRQRLAALRLIDEPRLLHRDAPEGLAEAIAVRFAQPLRGVQREKPRRGMPRVWALAAAAAVIVAAGTLGLGVLHHPSVRSSLIAVTLTLKDPGARSVSVVGDWNGWSPTAQPMRRSDGLWEIRLHLQKGRDYQYQFLVNAKSWIPDPNAPLKIPNGFGGVNSVLAT